MIPLPADIGECEATGWKTWDGNLVSRTILWFELPVDSAMPASRGQVLPGTLPQLDQPAPDQSAKAPIVISSPNVFSMDHSSAMSSIQRVHITFHEQSLCRSWPSSCGGLSRPR